MQLTSSMDRSQLTTSLKTLKLILLSPLRISMSLFRCAILFPLRRVSFVSALMSAWKRDSLSCLYSKKISIEKICWLLSSKKNSSKRILRLIISNTRTKKKIFLLLSSKMISGERILKLLNSKTRTRINMIRFMASNTRTSKDRQLFRGNSNRRRRIWNC